MHFSDSVSTCVSPIFLIVLALSLIYFIIIDEVTIFCASKVSMHRELDGGSIYLCFVLCSFSHHVQRPERPLQIKSAFETYITCQRFTSRAETEKNWHLIEHRYRITSLQTSPIPPLPFKILHG